jgi:hypothetical protein
MADVKDLVVGNTTVGANYLKHTIATSDAGRTLIVSVSKTDITDAELNTVINFMTISKGSSGLGDSAFTVAGVGTANGSPFVAGTTDVVYLRLQGTGVLTPGSDFAGVTGATVAVVCVFQPAK